MYREWWKCTSIVLVYYLLYTFIYVLQCESKVYSFTATTNTTNKRCEWETGEKAHILERHINLILNQLKNDFSARRRVLCACMWLCVCVTHCVHCDVKSPLILWASFVRHVATDGGFSVFHHHCIHLLRNIKEKAPAIFTIMGLEFLSHRFFFIAVHVLIAIARQHRPYKMERVLFRFNDSTKQNTI